MGRFSVHCGDGLEFVRSLPDASVDAVITDPPYNIGGKFAGRDKDRHAWDEFSSDSSFAAFIGSYLDEFSRVLKPTGSLFVFASPSHSSLVENEVKARFHVLNHIVWRKPSHSGGHQKKEALRRFWNGSERIIFAEQGEGSRDCENAKARANHAERASVFREIREYLHSEWVGAGMTNKDGGLATGTQMSGHYFGSSQWAFPKRAAYEALRAYAAEKGRDILNRSWDDLKARYDEIQREHALNADFNHLRRPFIVSADVPWDDVWTFPVVPPTNKNRHPCEKPLPLIEHIVRSSTRPGDVILDTFCGSGSLGEAALLNGRVPVLNDMDKRWSDAARLRCDNALKLVDRDGSLAVSRDKESFTREDKEDDNDEGTG